MLSYLLSVNCFEDKAIHIIKNMYQLTKYYSVPEGEFSEFLRHSTYLQSLSGSKIAQKAKIGINTGKAIAHY